MGSPKIISRLRMGSPKIILALRNKLAFCPLCRKTLKIPSCAAELLEKIKVIAHVIGKPENSGTKIDKLELDSECEPFFLENT